MNIKWSKIGIKIEGNYNCLEMKSNNIFILSDDENI